MSVGKEQKQPRSRRFHRQTEIGTAPGTIAVNPEAPAPTIDVTRYTDRSLRTERLTSSEIPGQASSDGEVLWIDVRGLGDAAVLHDLGEQFGLHALALEDVVNVHQHVKVEDYGEYLFVVARVVDNAAVGETRQISLFLGNSFCITFQESIHDDLVAVRKRLDNHQSRVRKEGVDFLAYAILDVVIDGYFPLLEQCGMQLDDLEDSVCDDPPRSVARDVHGMRKVLRSLRRVVWQHREAINLLLREPTELISEKTRTFLRDCHDHTVQLVDILEVYREMCSDLRDVYLSAVNQRMNEIMMVLTIMATIFIPLSFIAGLYGMNFNPKVSPWNMPELNWFYGYPFALILMASVAAGLLYYFHRRGWILQRESEDEM